MSLTLGTRLGPYEVLASIGAGGMGEVYRARDKRLNRDVAVKVLPASVASDEDRLRRFRVEAQTTGALNHPNILAIHDIGSHQGRPYIVSELLEGESMRERLRGGKLGVPKALDYARQIASGLAAAHAKGITHRDIKPENLFLTRDGRVKILDFGLAKVTPRSATANTGGDATETQTQGLMTMPGAVLGTVCYMSPEQVRGEPADHRSDVFSFGCVLYEMVGGRRAFGGDTSVETMNAILKEDPPELSTLDGTLPPALERIVRHCLEKNPEERFQSARDLAFGLESVSQSSGRVEPVKGPGKPAKSRLGWIVAAGLVLLALAAGYYAGTRGQHRASPTFQRLTFRRGVISSARFAPDGHTIVYGAAWEGERTNIFSVRLDSPEFHPMVTGEAMPLSVSSSGELALLLKPRVVAFQTTGTLARVPFSGGAPREVLERVQWVDWAPSGEMVVVRDGDKGNQLEFPVGKVLFRTAGIVTHPRFSPAADRIAFIHHPQANNDGGAIMVTDLNGQARTVADGWGSAWGLAWMSGTGEIWFTASVGGSKRELRAVTLSGRLRTILAQTGNLTLEDTSRDGSVLLNSIHEQMRLRFVDLKGKLEKDLSWLDWSLASDLSADGKSVAFYESGEGAGQHIAGYYRKTDGSPALKLGNVNSPRLAPDGQSVVAVAEGNGAVLILPIGPGEPRSFPLPGFMVLYADWAPDGRGILFTANEKGRGVRLYSMELEGGKPRPITPEGMGMSFKSSPDGKLVANANVKRQLLLVPLGGGEPSICPGTEPGERPYAWSEDSKLLYVMSRGALPAKVYRVDWRTGRRELWKEVSPPDPAGVNDISGIQITPDAQSYAYSYRQQLSELHLVEGLR